MHAARGTRRKTLSRGSSPARFDSAADRRRPRVSRRQYSDCLDTVGACPFPESRPVLGVRRRDVIFSRQRRPHPCSSTNTTPENNASRFPESSRSVFEFSGSAAHRSRGPPHAVRAMPPRKLQRAIGVPKRPNRPNARRPFA